MKSQDFGFLSFSLTFSKNLLKELATTRKLPRKLEKYKKYKYKKYP